MKKLLTFFFLLFSFHLVAQPGQRIKLTQLEQAKVVDGSRQGQIGMSNAAGDQRYTPYVIIADTCITTPPAPTGNTEISTFQYNCAGDSVWYIDWEGKSLLLIDGGGAVCDADWLQIVTNDCPDNINDSIYTYKYASVGARYAWPFAEFLVNDSTGTAIAVIQGDRNARLGFHDSNNDTWTAINFGGSTTSWYMQDGDDLVFTAASGSISVPTIPFTNHFAIRTNDSTLVFYRYPNTRADTNTVVNILHTDAAGVLRSAPLATIIPAPQSLTVENGEAGAYNLVLSGNPDTVILAPGNNIILSALGNEIAINALNTDLSYTGDSVAVTLNSSTGADVVFADSTGIGLYRRNDTLFIYATGGGGGGVSLPLNEIGYGTGAGITSSANLLATPTSSGYRVQLNAQDAGSGFSVDSVASAGTGYGMTSVAGGTSAVNALQATRTSGTGNLNIVLDNQGSGVTQTYMSSSGSDVRTVYVGQGENWATGYNFTDSSYTIGGGIALNSPAFQVRPDYTLVATAGTTATNTNTSRIIVRTNSTGTVNNGFGGSINFQGESSTTENRDMGYLSSYWVSATDASRTGGFKFFGTNNTVSNTEYLRIGPVSSGSSPTLSIANGAAKYGASQISSTSAFILSSTNISSSALTVYGGNSNNAGGMILGFPGNSNITTGTKSNINIVTGFNPGSGTAVLNLLEFSGTINQTGSASGITRGIYLNNAITAAANYRALEIATNSASARGLYQTGASTINNMVGKTMLASTGSPATILDAGDATDGIVTPNGTTAQRVVHNGVIRYNTDNESLETYINNRWDRLATTSIPSVAAGAAAGTGPSISVNGNDLGGYVTINTGTSTTTGDLFTVTFGAAFDALCTCSVTFSAGDDNTASRISNFSISTHSNTSFTLNAGGALPESTQYEFHYKVNQ